MVLPAREVRNEEESGSSQPGAGAPTTELGGEEELRKMGKSGEGPSVAVASGLTDEGKQEGTSHISQEREHSPQKPVPKSIGGPKAVQPVPVLVPPVKHMSHMLPRAQ